jgi:signal peptidase I
MTRLLLALLIASSAWASPSREEDLALATVIAKSEYHGIAATGSMKPTFDETYWALGHKPEDSPFESLRVGDIIFFEAPWWPGDAWVCHRIVAISSNHTYVVTKGDNNDRTDPFLVTKAAYRGRIVGWIKKPYALIDL